MKKPSNLGTYSKIGLAIALASVFLLGMVGIAGATSPNPTWTPLVSTTYTIVNHPDSGYTGGSGKYWALDNITANLQIWSLGGTNYYVNETDTGTWCTWNGLPSPQAGILQTYNGCGAINGGYDADFVSATPPTAATLSPSNDDSSLAALLGSGNPSSITRPSVADGDYWETALLSSAPALTSEQWSWTYTTAGAGPWIDALSRSTGDIVLTAGTGTGITASEQVQPAPLPICALGLNNNVVTFPALYGGEAVAPAVGTGVTVTNESTVVPYLGGPSVGVSTGVTVSGTNWVGTNPAHTMPVGQTGVLLGTSTATSPQTKYTSQFPLTSSPSGDIIDLAPTGGQAQLLFGLTVPNGQPTDTYTQGITVATTC